MHNLWNVVSSGHHFASSISAPYCMKSVSNGIHLAPLEDKFLQGMELFLVSWLVTFRIVEDKMFVVF